jgi:hypothetical protein
MLPFKQLGSSDESSAPYLATFLPISDTCSVDAVMAV